MLDVISQLHGPDKKRAPRYYNKKIKLDETNSELEVTEVKQQLGV